MPEKENADEDMVVAIQNVHAAVKNELRKVLVDLGNLPQRDETKVLGLPPLIPIPRNARKDELEIPTKLEQHAMQIIEKSENVRRKAIEGKFRLEELQKRRSEIEEKLSVTRLQIARKMMEIKKQRQMIEYEKKEFQLIKEDVGDIKEAISRGMQEFKTYNKEYLRLRNVRKQISNDPIGEALKSLMSLTCKTILLLLIWVWVQNQRAGIVGRNRTLA